MVCRRGYGHKRASLTWACECNARPVPTMRAVVSEANGTRGVYFSNYVEVWIDARLSHISMIPLPSFANPPITIFVSFVTRALTFSSPGASFLHNSSTILSPSLFILHCIIVPRRVEAVSMSELEKDLHEVDIRGWSLNESRRQRTLQLLVRRRLLYRLVHRPLIRSTFWILLAPCFLKVFSDLRVLSRDDHLRSQPQEYQSRRMLSTWRMGERAILLLPWMKSLQRGSWTRRNFLIGIHTDFALREYIAF